MSAPRRLGRIDPLVRPAAGANPAENARVTASTPLSWVRTTCRRIGRESIRARRDTIFDPVTARIPRHLEKRTLTPLARLLQASPPWQSSPAATAPGRSINVLVSGHPFCSIDVNGG
jgi:hypothetical protein